MRNLILMGLFGSVLLFWTGAVLRRAPPTRVVRNEMKASSFRPAAPSVESIVDAFPDATPSKPIMPVPAIKATALHERVMSNTPAPSTRQADPVVASADPSVAIKENIAPPPDIDQVMLSYHPLMDRDLSPDERAASLAPELHDAILRVEGMYDPTRIGAFGAALRMHVRPGTASMSNVFADRWTRADEDPNVHYRVNYLAEVWLQPGVRDCDAFARFRPDDSAILLDRLTPSDCRNLVEFRDVRDEPLLRAKIVEAPLSLPAFAAPYPGGRFSSEELRIVQEARVQAVRERLWFK